MKTLEQIKQAYADKEIEACFPDGRNIGRLLRFFPESDWSHFGFEKAEGADPHVPCELTREAVIEKLKGDVEFGFDKATGQRGISAAAMNAVVKTWLTILDDKDFDHIDYAQYGLPLLKAVALKYGFPNEIGEDSGAESKYAASY